LWSKLHRPQAGPQFVRRPRLESRLDRGLDRWLVLVSAPAGSGKTTLVSQWLEAGDCPAAWLSLHERDGDLATFLRYLIAAVRTLFPDACPATWLLLRAPQLPPVEHLAVSLIHELGEVPQQFLLVLDDYHRVQSRPYGRRGSRGIDAPVDAPGPDYPRRPLVAAGRAARRAEMLELRAADLRSRRTSSGLFGNRWAWRWTRIADRPESAPRAGSPGCGWRRWRCATPAI
jgi:LuxR family maltose regulon positive regulatory protein